MAQKVCTMSGDINVQSMETLCAENISDKKKINRRRTRQKSKSSKGSPVDDLDVIVEKVESVVINTDGTECISSSQTVDSSFHSALSAAPPRKIDKKKRVNVVLKQFTECVPIVLEGDKNSTTLENGMNSSKSLGSSLTSERNTLQEPNESTMCSGAKLKKIKKVPKKSQESKSVSSPQGNDSKKVNVVEKRESPKKLSNPGAHKLENIGQVNVNAKSKKGGNQVHNSPGKSKKSIQTLEKELPAKNRKSRTKEPSDSDENVFDHHIPIPLVEKLILMPGYIRGPLRINQRNYRESYITCPNGGKDILIDGVKYRNRALEGDEVLVQLFPVNQWKLFEGQMQRTGKIIHIFEMVHHRQAVGTLKATDRSHTYLLFSPRDPRIPRIRIPKTLCQITVNEKALYMARITKWDDVRFACGMLISEIGLAGDIAAETQAIMCENELDDQPFDKILYKYVPKSPFEIPEEEINRRIDLRQSCIFTIDPMTAVDLDDAMSCKKLSNGNYEVGVHISDVSYFLTQGTPLDVAVSKRATTVYLVQVAYHMLPRELTLMCSLLPGDDRLAFSVFWEITPECKIVSHRFSKTVINSCAKFAYDHVQVLLDTPDYEWKDGELPVIYNGYTIGDIKDTVFVLNDFAKIMRKGRFDAGALRIDQPKLCFSFDDTGMPKSFSKYEHNPSHQLIEEFMLLANVTVATTLSKHFPNQAFLRCHDPPAPDMLKRLQDSLEKVGVELDISSSGTLQNSLRKISETESLSRQIAINLLCSKPMARAAYYCACSRADEENRQHYALHIPLYTHFTSPIRRYADVIVHRQLSSIINYSKEPLLPTEILMSLASNCNKQKFSAKKAGEMSSNMYLAIWLGRCGPLVEEAVVIDVKDHSFDVVGCSTGTNIRVYTDKLAAVAEFSNDNVPQLDLVWASTDSKPVHQTIVLLSTVTIVLRPSVVNNLKLEATLVPPESK